MALYTSALNEIKGARGWFAKTSVAKQAASVAENLSSRGVDIGAAARNHASMMGAAKYTAIGAASGAAIGAGKAAYNGDDATIGAVTGAAYGAAGGLGAYGATTAARGLRSSGGYKPSWYRNSTTAGPQNIYRYSTAAGPANNKSWQMGSSLGKSTMSYAQRASSRATGLPQNMGLW